MTDPIQIATDRTADDERRTRKAKIAGIELLEAVLCCPEDQLPATVREKRRVVMALNEGE